MMRLNPVASVEDALNQVAQCRNIVVMIGVPAHHPCKKLRVAGAAS